jgi:hypothetical protein
MAVSYQKLFKLLMDHDMKKKGLRERMEYLKSKKQKGNDELGLL